MTEVTRDRRQRDALHEPLDRERPATLHEAAAPQAEIGYGDAKDETSLQAVPPPAADGLEQVPETTNRASLKTTWEDLQTEHQALLAEGARLQGSEDAAAAAAYRERLRTYQARLTAWGQTVHRFHTSHGPIGLNDRDSGTS